jgi:hypothetical protein
MSIGFEAVFSSTTKPLPEILSAVKGALRDFRIDFPDATLSSLGDQTSSAMGVPSWVSLHCVSRSLWTALGPGDAAEVDVSIIKGKQGFYLKYQEHQAAFRRRLTDERLAEELYGLLLRFCSEVKSQVCVYDEESSTGFKPPTVEKVRSILEAEQFPSGGKEGVIVLSQELMSLKEAQALCPKPPRVSLTKGWLVFKLLLSGRT